MLKPKYCKPLDIKLVSVLCYIGGILSAVAAFFWILSIYTGQDTEYIHAWVLNFYLLDTKQEFVIYYSFFAGLSFYTGWGVARFKPLAWWLFVIVLFDIRDNRALFSDNQLLLCLGIAHKLLLLTWAIIRIPYYRPFAAIINKFKNNGSRTK